MSKSENCGDNISFEVHFEDAINFGENDRVSNTILSWFEVKLHANLLEKFNILKDDSVNLSELIISSVWILLSLEYEELICLLLIHDENLTRNNSQVLFILALGHGNNLTGFSRVSFEKRDGH